MITVSEWLSAVLAMEKEQPVYRTGGTGADGTCDCIGVVMGAMYRLGHADYPLHSSNYFARCQTDGLQAVNAASDLKPGQVVYKAKDDPSGLHDRYLPGGAYCTGDTRDYYHAGVVVSAEPLSIVHCTSADGVNGFTRDTRLGKWQWAGTVHGLCDAPAERIPAVVTVSAGTTANLRLRPTRKSRRIAKVPAGAAVSILEQAQGWAKILTPEGAQGYMMMDYLKTGRTLESRVADLEQRVAILEGGKKE